MANRLVEAGRFTLIRNENGELLWEGAPAGEETHYLEEVNLRPQHWAVGTVVVVHEPQELPAQEQRRVYGSSMTIERDKK